MPRTATAPHHTTTPKPSQHAPQLATEPQAAPAAAAQGPSTHVSATTDDKWHRWHLPGICGSLGPAANRRAGMCVCNLSLGVHHRLHPDFLLRTACSATDGPRDADTLTGEEMPLCRLSSNSSPGRGGGRSSDYRPAAGCATMTPSRVADTTSQTATVGCSPACTHALWDPLRCPLRERFINPHQSYSSSSSCQLQTIIMAHIFALASISESTPNAEVETKTSAKTG